VPLVVFTSVRSVYVTFSWDTQAANWIKPIVRMARQNEVRIVNQL
jgi:hypothetical protein